MVTRLTVSSLGRLSDVVCLVDIHCQLLSQKMCSKTNYIYRQKCAFFALFLKKFSYLRFFRVFSVFALRNPDKIAPKTPLCYGQTKNASVFSCKIAGVFVNAKIRLPAFCFVFLLTPLYIKNKPFFLYTIWFFHKKPYVSMLARKKCTFRFV